MCQELDMDKKDLISFFQELRIWFRNNSKCIDTPTKTSIQKSNISLTGSNDDSTTILGKLETVFEDSSICRLDIKRIYRYLDKNAIKDCDDSEISCG
jgi:hypothetical protein